MRTRDIVLLAGLGALALWYFKKRTIAAAAAVAAIPAQVGESIANALYDWVNPDQVGVSVFYTVTFPDKIRHAIPANLVDPDGGFVLSGVSYMIKNDANGNHFAVAV